MKNKLLKIFGHGMDIGFQDHIGEIRIGEDGEEDGGKIKVYNFY